MDQLPLSLLVILRGGRGRRTRRRDTASRFSCERKIMMLSRPLVFSCSAVLLAACGASVAPPPAPVVHIAVRGDWDDSMGNETKITDAAWGADTITKWDNTTKSAIVKSSAMATTMPNTFGKVQWIPPKDGAFYYCWVDTGEATEAAVEAAMKTADPKDLTLGCNKGQWGKFGPHVAEITIAGTWDDDAGDTVTISKKAWVTVNGMSTSTSAVSAFQNMSFFVVLQSPSNDPTSPNTYSRVLWTPIVSNSFYVCVVESGLSTSAEALMNKTADSTDPATKGCNGMPWSKMTKHAM
jgi:hypothetical protein